jgi:hypothetical protein
VMKLLGRHVCRGEDNIQMGVIHCEDVHWVHLAQDVVKWQALLNTVVMNRCIS